MSFLGRTGWISLRIQVKLIDYNHILHYLDLTDAQIKYSWFLPLSGVDRLRERKHMVAVIAPPGSIRQRNRPALLVKHQVWPFPLAQRDCRPVREHHLVAECIVGRELPARTTIGTPRVATRSPTTGLLNVGVEDCMERARVGRTRCCDPLMTFHISQANISQCLRAHMMYRLVGAW